MRSTVFLLMAGVALGATAPSNAAEPATAIFAGGCFWCVESDFDHVDGVTRTISGYIGGSGANPTYKSHTAGGFKEAVEITYDPEMVSYDELLRLFFRSVDPTDGGGQFCDRGASYSTAVYALDDAQARAAEAAKIEAAAALQQPIKTEIVDAPKFWPAEDYHQDYYRKNPLQYKFYRFRCGRDARLKELWGDQAYYGQNS
ncbi:peptide-methionine (S)-S-oxide reductase MsrA [Pseudohoeflea coraliihabitans]|uniref:Peptide methionine sulfoxide reductase MsrA n=1 Tax=Pseudohoeflea coraliihabitans TaxID=2860393 RepID=A0ABS6WM77_9HYPH|nr:peptide-methionine (S)-S-oxide reductase MsrA [Pseudohoeflea sp. DP4N28-3]MBW3096753.1 peptide-methionine (S)-S-oxide reductase MsrA [Pseudohoeflea sp. DP4N28-3]